MHGVALAVRLGVDFHLNMGTEIRQISRSSRVTYLLLLCDCTANKGRREKVCTFVLFVAFTETVSKNICNPNTVYTIHIFLAFWCELELFNNEIRFMIHFFFFCKFYYTGTFFSQATPEAC